MKIVFISDTHNQHRKVTLPLGDVLVHAGDVSGRGSKEEVQDFLHWFSEQPFKYKIFIAGNHDFFIQDHPAEFRAMLPSNVIYLQDEMTEIEGVKIWGSPWTPEYMNWAFMKAHGKEIEEKWDMIPDDIDVLLTHGPMVGVLDQIFSGLSVGCAALSTAVQRINPKYFLFGHIHESYGRQQSGATHFINGAVLNENYELSNDPVVIDFL